MNRNNIRRGFYALGSLAMFGSALWVTGAHADGSNRTLMLSVYLDSAGGASALSGNYAAAIKEIESRGPYDNMGTLAAETNLCVAYTMRQQWDEAQKKCDAAVAGARLSDADDVFDFGAGRNRRLATAYSNRAVMHSLQKQSAQALADLRRARSLAPRLEFVAHNWIALNQEPDSSARPTVASIQP